MEKLKLFLLVLQIVNLINAKTFILVDEKIERCTVDNYDNNFEVFDYSNFQIIPENDTHTFINGSLEARLDIKSPWYVHIQTEHYERGQWLLQAFTKTFKDFCPEMKNPLQPWYYVMKDSQGCVVPKGTIYDYDMLAITFPDSLLNALPRHYMGKWRCVVHLSFNIDGVKKMDCKRYFANIYFE